MADNIYRQPKGEGVSNKIMKRAKASPIVQSNTNCVAISGNLPDGFINQKLMWNSSKKNSYDVMSERGLKVIGDQIWVETVELSRKNDMIRTPSAREKTPMCQGDKRGNHGADEYCIG
ncbi:hypothetical protein M9H77_22242 [Catharanthus roseus]|uniref:Uncharacterized protein n=1 Tax=Catharanthus roseus TaxID=4058 RepID=A0ACC0APY4_CATRO|nr:hypothetical protein M9H77_22242 [Catharanthus roseus]